MAGLGSILTDEGRFTEAEPLLRRALAIDEKALPEGDWQRSQMKSLLGASLADLRRYTEGEEDMPDPLAITVSNNAPHPNGNAAVLS